jgi:2-haloacid dehalogenase
MSFAPPKALTFDVFGTVVNLSGSLFKQGELILKSHGIHAAWKTLAAEWVVTYSSLIAAVGAGSIPWDDADALALLGLEQVLTSAGLTVSATVTAELAAIWQKLEPWPDSRPGLDRLRTRCLVFALSNGTATTLAHIARHGRLPWDGIFSAGSVRAYKPDPRVYQMALDGLGLAPGEVMMVASHRFDLDAANAAGMSTAFIDRPQEPAGPGTTVPDITCATIEGLATALGV